MGVFSYECSNRCCSQSRDQFDWIEPCVVKVDTKNGKDVYVDGSYNMYGGVDIKTKDGKTVTVYLREFEDNFDCWGEVKYTASEIYCNGTNEDDEDEDYEIPERYCYRRNDQTESCVDVECLKVYGDSEPKPEPTEEEKKRYKYALKIKKIYEEKLKEANEIIKKYESIY